MAKPTGGTGLAGSSTSAVVAQLINPQVIGAFLAKKLIDNIVFAPLAYVDTTLQGVPGNTLSIPQWDYIGDATDVAEYEEIVSSELKSTMTTATIKKVVKAVTLSDEAILSAHIRPVDEATNQIALAVASKIDNDIVANIKDTTPVEIENLGADQNYEWVLDAQVEFGEEFDEATYLFINPKQRASILKSPDFVYVENGNRKVTGEVGTIFGVNVVISNKILADEAIMLKEGAISILLKRGFMVEPIREGKIRATTISADQHYTTYVRDLTKVKYLTKKA